MCIAIPLGCKEKESESVIWRSILNSPLYLLGLGAVLQIFLLVIFLFSLNTELISNSLILKSQLIIFTIILSGIGGFIFFALSMHFYSKMMPTDNIEYWYYGGYFFLASFNLCFFYFANLFSYALMLSSVIVQLCLLLFAFKPIWNAYYWIDNRNKNFGRLINSLFLLIFTAQLLIFWQMI